MKATQEAWPATVKFLKAVIKGWVYAAENPEEASEITIAEGASVTVIQTESRPPLERTPAVIQFDRHRRLINSCR